MTCFFMVVPFRDWCWWREVSHHGVAHVSMHGGMAFACDHAGIAKRLTND
jgi:hypothetical protein